MKVFLIRSDHRCYSLLPKDPAFFDKVGLFDGQPIEGIWSRLDDQERAFQVREPDTTRAGGFHDLVLGCLVYGDAVRMSKVGGILGKSGEVLPGTIEGYGPVFVLNPLASYPCFDLERSNYRKAGTAVVQVFEHVFLPDEIGDASVFKAQVRKRTSIYTVSDRGDPENDFYHQYQEACLSGLIFEEVWRS
ncbi:hypothetical protein OKA04_19200 [Luteolibacter flavescens]|uniref:Uncharacterized protein n=1 Tax=Luteolibacter flavescens TaxID=1859460 RepID=A0ABT3FTI5_9BACT|nr:hypothetical protein [Luteolibacter flavescens]MCW1886875.1 hypothetical protein [Luteolibacter flavescens]